MRKLFKWCLVGIVSVILALGITCAFFPQPQFIIELEDNRATIYTYHNQGTSFSMKKNNATCFEGHIPFGYWEKPYDIVIETNGNKIVSARINDKTINNRNIIRIKDIAGFGTDFLNTSVIKTNELNAGNIIIFIAIFTLLMYLAYRIMIEVKNLLVQNSLPVYTIVQSISWKKMAGMVGLVVVLSGFFAVGSDIDVIIGVMNLTGRGIDIYQLEAACNQRLQIGLLVWPYNLPMLLFYFIATIPTMLGFPFFEVGNYHILYYLVYKIINSILLFLTIVGVLGMAASYKHIESQKCNSTIYWSLFNPITFYVAIIYIQLDIFPACCIAWAVLLLINKKCPVLTGILFGVGISCKQQNILLAPVILFLIYFLLMKDISKGRKIEKGNRAVAIVTITTTMLALLPNFLGNTPLNLMMKYNPQGERVWWTSITYAPNLYFLITPAILIFFVLINLFRINLQMSEKAVAVNSLLMMGVVVLTFSFSIMSTPSTLLHSIAAFTLVYVFAEDDFQRLLIFSFSFLLVVEVMCASYGDILRLLGDIGGPSFTSIERKLIGTEEGVRYSSLIFTVSHSAMLAYSLLFFKYAGKILENGEED